MSPSKMRRHRAYSDGEQARHEGQPRESNPHERTWSDAHQAWDLGWQEAEENEARRNPPPTDVEAAIARGDLTMALYEAKDVADLKEVLAAVIERLDA